METTLLRYYHSFKYGQKFKFNKQTNKQNPSLIVVQTKMFEAQFVTSILKRDNETYALMLCPMLHRDL